MQSQPTKPRGDNELTHDYRANAFTLKHPDGWQDKTIFTLVGPVENGIQHNVIVALETDVPYASVRDFAEVQINAMVNELKSCRLLKKGAISLANGLQAFQAIYTWFPTDDLRIYQEHIYILVDKTAYRLAASFTKKTRKTLGPLVERMMLSFEPGRPVAGSAAVSRKPTP